MAYSEDEMLMLSGIQHFVFCPRQWALIHIEQQWAENRLTAEGQMLHTNADNPFYRQKNGDKLTLRSVHIASSELGLYGVCDAIELKPAINSANAISHPNYDGFWTPYPVEYKRGHHKPDLRDIVQVVAQVMCIEEMCGICIQEAALFYWEIRRRETVTITNELRDQTKKISTEMHRIFESGQTPSAVYKSSCKNCSLYDICLPEIRKCNSVSNYLKTNLYEETT